MSKNYYEYVAFSEFNLKGLTQFNRALIYGFERENSLLLERNDETNPECYIFVASQFQDMLDAYEYAQNVIIPAIEKTGKDKITLEMVIQWLDQIHLRIARTLAQDHTDAKVPGAIAGEPCERQISRWHQGKRVADCCKTFLSGKAPAEADFAASLGMCGIPYSTAVQFVKILEKVKKDKTLEIPPYEKAYLDPTAPCVVGQILLTKLSVAYHTDKKLTENERKCVEKVVKICSPPEKFPEIRQQFARDFLERLKNVNPKDLNEVGRLIFFIFFRITDGHWWFNGNGRATTCFLNTILRILGYSSILVRNPSEKKDLKSSYTRGVTLIDDQPKIMQDHLTTRLAETSKGNFYRSEVEENQLILKVKLGKLLAQIKCQFPKYDIDRFFKSVLMVMNQNLVLLGITDRSQQIDFLLSKYIEQTTILLEKLHQEKTNSFVTNLSTPAAAQTASKSENNPEKPNVNQTLVP